MFEFKIIFCSSKTTHMNKLFLIASLLLCSFAVHAQTISGHVQDAATKESLIGVTIQIKGTNIGTKTDDAGNYTVKAKPNETMLVSYVGYVKKEIKIESAGTLNIELEKNENNSLKSVTVVGSRKSGRTNTESPVPIDVIDIGNVTKQSGKMDVNQMLQMAAPSFNANKQSGSDGADHIDPASLRGLGPDQTLVLINGKRRHQSSLINLFGTRGRGNTGTDLNTIPAAAIERIEILRDGSSAQYGSDAIAGVMNIVLKKNTQELTGNINYGVYDAGNNNPTKKYDGQSVQANLNYGFKLGNDGYINVTGDILSSAKTNRIPPNNTITYRNQFGDGSSVNGSIWLNGAKDLSKNTNLYFFGGFNSRFSDAYAWTRTGTVTVDDINDSIIAKNPVVTNERSNAALYPNGFDPKIQAKIKDLSLSVGLKHKAGKWMLDLNNTYGQNKFHYYNANTLNASLGASSPTSFDAGGFGFAQNTSSLNATRGFDILNGLNFSAGVEFRLDQYDIVEGEEGSWKNYLQNFRVDTFINKNTSSIVELDTVYSPGGAQGFPGFQPKSALKSTRSNIGAFVDAELDITKQWLLGAAIRFENYSDFGKTLNGKLASRYRISDKINIRASVSSGFRAPSLQQIYFNTIYTNFEGGQPIEIQLANNSSALATKVGMPTLKQEKSFNYSVGLTIKPIKAFTITADAYMVKVKDRIILTGTFYNDDNVIGSDLVALNVGAVNFFTNAVNTTNQGLDIILTYNRKIGKGRLTTSLASNFNKLVVDKVNTTSKLAGKEDVYFSNREKAFLIASAPKSKLNFTATYEINSLSVTYRLVRYGEVILLGYDDKQQIYNPKLVSDLAIGYSINKHIGINIGVDNLLNAYPDKQDIENTESGGAWDPVQMNYNGRRYFARLGFRF